MKFKDQIGNVLQLQNTPKRIISFVPSITELLVDLGLESSIVGVTKFCVHPKNLIKKKIVIGGTKTIKLDTVSNLKPDFIICNKEENTKEIVENCKQITATYVSDIYSVADTLDLIYQFGKIFSCETKAKKLILEIEKEQCQFSEFIEDKKPKNVAYFIWKKPWMVAANNTFINHLLDLNKFKNVFEGKNRYPEINFSELKKIKNLDYIFLSSEPYPFKEKDILSLQNELKNVKIVLVDGEFFSWYGSRLIKAFNYFKTLHKEII